MEASLRDHFKSISRLLFKASFHSLLAARSSLLASHCNSQPAITQSLRKRLLYIKVGKLPFAVSAPKIADLTILLHKRTLAFKICCVQASSLLWCPVFKSASSSWTNHVISLSGWLKGISLIGIHFQLKPSQAPPNTRSAPCRSGFHSEIQKNLSIGVFICCSGNLWVWQKSWPHHPLLFWLSSCLEEMIRKWPGWLWWGTHSTGALALDRIERSWWMFQWKERNFYSRLVSAFRDKLERCHSVRRGRCDLKRDFYYNRLTDVQTANLELLSDTWEIFQKEKWKLIVRNISFRYGKLIVKNHRTSYLHRFNQTSLDKE